MSSESPSVSQQKPHQFRIKFKSTLWFMFLLLLVVILNFISPCDGRGGNLFSIVYKKMKGTYVQNVFDSIPFVYSVSNITVISSGLISYQFNANHPSKVVCITGRSDTDGWSLSFVETDSNRFYYHSNKGYEQQLPISPEIGESSRLFCKVFDLGVVGSPMYMFTSDPFVIRYSTLSLQYLHRSEDEAYFKVHPQQLYTETLPSSSSFESGEIEMVCSRHFLFSKTEDDYPHLSIRGFLPLHFSVESHENESLEVSCQVLSVQNQTPIISHPLSVVIAPISNESPVIYYCLEETNYY